MKILFIYPDVITPMINFCPAVHVLSAVMTRAGHQTALIHVNNEQGTPFNREAVIRQAQQEQPGLFAVTSTSFNYRHANEIAAWLKSAMPHVPRILGGSHATVQPEDFESSHFDAFCVGEGEEPLLEIASAIDQGCDWRTIPNLIVRRPDGAISRNPVRGFLRNLDSLPFQDFSITDTPKLLKARQGWMSLSFSRGCPYECTFCINHIYKQCMIGPNDTLAHYLRRRSPANTVDELESLARRYPGGIKVFNFDDDLLPMDKAWMKDFGERYRRQVLLPFGIQYAMNCRASFLDDKLAALFADSGCLEVRIGFETGNEAMRTEVLGKPVRDAELIRAFAACDRCGVHTNAFAMMGIPGESEQSFADTVRMIHRLKPFLIRMTFLYPYTHTRIYDRCVKDNLFKPNPAQEDSFTESPLQFEHLTDAQVFCFRFLFPWHVNVFWFGESEEGGIYRELIERFQVRPIEDLRQSIPEIVECDTKAGDRCRRPHYRYFRGNVYYFQLNGKYNPNGKVLVACEP